MTKLSRITFVICTLTTAMCACGSKSSKMDRRCPMLVEKAEYYNAKVANGANEGPMGMKMSVEYIDTVYRIIQVVDENVIPIEKLKMFYGNQKLNMIASLSSATGQERNDYQQMVNYRVTFEHVVKSKNTGDVIVQTTMTPDEIANALSHKMSHMDELKMNVTTLKGTLPRGMEAGYTMNDISCSNGVVNIEIIVDEKMTDFDEATKLKTWSKAEQAVTLADQTTGLTFWSVAAQVPAEFDFHFVGSKGNNDLHIRFSKDEVVEFNEVMERIKNQQSF